VEEIGGIEAWSMVTSGISLTRNRNVVGRRRRLWAVLVGLTLLAAAVAVSVGHLGPLEGTGPTARTDRSSSAPTEEAPGPSCSPPFYFDEAGIKRPKQECLR
jgi:hypothetical protein